MDIASLPEIRLDLRNTGLSDIALTDCGLTGANLSGAGLRDCILHGAMVSESTDRNLVAGLPADPMNDDSPSHHRRPENAPD